MELKVWVEGIQRVICGVTEVTTCQDVVIALAHATGKTGRFTLAEKWRDNERLLAPTDNPLKVLHKWGEYATDVQFVLRHSDKTAKSHNKPAEDSPGSSSSDNSQNKQFSHNFSPGGRPSAADVQQSGLKKSLTFSGAHNYFAPQKYAKGQPGPPIAENSNLPIPTEPPPYNTLQPPAYSAIDQQRKQHFRLGPQYNSLPDRSTSRPGLMKPGINTQKTSTQPTGTQERTQLENEPLNNNNSKSIISPYNTLEKQPHGKPPLSRKSPGPSPMNSLDRKKYGPSTINSLDRKQHGPSSMNNMDRKQYGPSQINSLDRKQPPSYTKAILSKSPQVSLDTTTKSVFSRQPHVHASRSSPSVSSPHGRSSPHGSLQSPNSSTESPRGSLQSPTGSIGSPYSPSSNSTFSYHSTGSGSLSRLSPKVYTQPPTKLHTPEVYTPEVQGNSPQITPRYSHNQHQGGELLHQNNTAPNLPIYHSQSPSGSSIHTSSSREGGMEEYDLDKNLPDVTQDTTDSGYNEKEDKVTLHDETEMEELRKLVAEQQDRLQKQESQMSIVLSDITYWEAKEKDMNKQETSLSLELQKLEKRERDYEIEITELDSAHLPDTLRVEEQTERSLQSDLTMLQSKLANSQTDLETNQEKITVLENEIKLEMQKLNDERLKVEQNMDTTIDELKKEIKTGLEQTEKDKDKINESESEIEQLKSAIANKEKEIEQIDNDIKDANMQLFSTVMKPLKDLGGHTSQRSFDETGSSSPSTSRPGSARKLNVNPQALAETLATGNHPHGMWV
ncbi:unnamed protein product [Owenia fusiformis]|uniref:Uncharacterized protein n=1 Tax=Owenia fusiformis TaxID=6347 RepID=A0A8J1XVU3_OWEFU|nr:unnamed protein product [Owenia fusiformis]